MRDKTSRAQSDMRTLENALVAYHLDCGQYPPRLTPELTTPTPYITEIRHDPFSKNKAPYAYFTHDDAVVLWCTDRWGKNAPDWPATMTTATLQRLVTDEAFHLSVRYDATQGIASKGTVFRLIYPSEPAQK